VALEHHDSDLNTSPKSCTPIIVVPHILILFDFYLAQFSSLGAEMLLLFIT
jgi:hypothetical protein